MTGVKPIMLYSSITTSIAKITPAIGVLNDAAIAPAVPHPTIRRRLLLGRWKIRPICEPAPAPRWTAGPSVPPD